MLPLTRKAIADVTHRKLRTAMVVLGILVGVLGLTAVNTAAGAIASALSYSSGQTPRANLQIEVRSAGPAAVASVTSIPNVRAAQLVTLYNTRWRISGAPGHANLQIVGSGDLSRLPLNSFQVASGRLPGRGEILMEASDRSLQAIRVGDEITVDVAGGPVHLHVSGTAHTRGVNSPILTSQALAYMRGPDLGALTGTGPNTLQVAVDDTSKLDATEHDVLSRLAAEHVTVLDALAFPNPYNPAVVNGLFALMRVLSLIALLLTGFLILNTVSTLVAEQVAVVGSMRAMGATTGSVVRGYLTSVLLYAVAGTVAGVAAGIAVGEVLAGYVAGLITVDLGPYSLDPSTLAAAVAVGIGIPVLAAGGPLRSATRITVREAIAGHGLAAAGGRSARRPAVGPQTVWLGIRSVFRRRVRAVMTLAALALSGTAFLAISTSTYSVDVLLAGLFQQYGGDAFVNVSPRPDAEVRSLLLAVPNVETVERFDQWEAKTAYGQISLSGTENHPTLYRYDLRSGRLFTPDEMGVVLLNEAAAQRSDLKVGDSMTFTLNGNTERWKVIGVVHDPNANSGDIGTAFTSLAQIHELQGVPPDLGASYIVGARDRSQAAVDRMAAGIDSRLTAAGLNPNVETSQQNRRRVDQQDQIIYVLLYAVAALVGAIGLLALFNTLTTSVLERRREIGILRSMGASSRHVATVFLTEALGFAVVGWALAAIAGIPAAYAFVALIGRVLIPVPFAFDPLALLLMLAVMVGIATLATVIPTLGASRQRITDSLRYE